jgi:hypothetical protein
MTAGLAGIQSDAKLKKNNLKNFKNLIKKKYISNFCTVNNRHAPIHQYQIKDKDL